MTPTVGISHRDTALGGVRVLHGTGMVLLISVRFIQRMNRCSIIDIDITWVEEVELESVLSNLKDCRLFVSHCNRLIGLHVARAPSAIALVKPALVGGANRRRIT